MVSPMMGAAGGAFSQNLMNALMMQKMMAAQGQGGQGQNPRPNYMLGGAGMPTQNMGEVGPSVPPMPEHNQMFGQTVNEAAKGDFGAMPPAGQAMQVPPMPQRQPQTGGAMFAGGQTSGQVSPALMAALAARQGQGGGNWMPQDTPWPFPASAY